jgi:hypothetical protein
MSLRIFKVELCEPSGSIIESVNIIDPVGDIRAKFETEMKPHHLIKSTLL